jgi:hypothetical protein
MEWRELYVTLQLPPNIKAPETLEPIRQRKKIKRFSIKFSLEHLMSRLYSFLPDVGQPNARGSTGHPTSCPVADLEFLTPNVKVNTRPLQPCDIAR